MKSVFVSIFILLLPLAAQAQRSLYLHASVEMHVTGNSDYQVYQTHDSPVFDDVVKVTLADSIALVVVDDHDSLRNTIVDMQHHFPFAEPPPYPCTASCSFQCDSLTRILTTIRINGNTLHGVSFAFAIDSLRVVRSSDSIWTVLPQEVPCSYILSYDDRYLMPNGQNGRDVASGQGQTMFAVSDPLYVRPHYEHTSLRITSLENGVVQIEGDSHDPSQALEVFDALGRSVYHTHFDGSAVRIAELRSGYYFAHLGNDVVKFAVAR